MLRTKPSRMAVRRNKKLAKAFGSDDWASFKNYSGKHRHVERFADPGYDDFSRRRNTIGKDKELAELDALHELEPEIVFDDEPIADYIGSDDYLDVELRLQDDELRFRRLERELQEEACWAQDIDAYHELQRDYYGEEYIAESMADDDFNPMLHVARFIPVANLNQDWYLQDEAA